MIKEESLVENNQSQMRKGVLEYCILLTISQGEMYASDILKELKHANLIVVEGTLYPLLSRLKTSGFLNYTWAESSEGPPRKYYTLTDKGQKNLEILNNSWHALSSSINSLIKKYEKNS